MNEISKFKSLYSKNYTKLLYSLKSIFYTHGYETFMRGGSFRCVKDLLDETTEMPAKNFVIVFSNDKLTETTDLPWRAKNSRSNCFEMSSRLVLYIF